MAGEQPRPLAYPGGLAPEEVRRHSFSTSFRGFHQAQVRDFLDLAAAELARLAAREAELVNDLNQARQLAAKPRLDEAALTEALGHEAAQILHSAHEAGADIRKKAEDNAARILREAHQQAESVRHAAESLLSERTAEADRAAEAVRAAAHAEAAALVARARQEAETALAEARARFDAMSEEAETFKNRMLGELSRRRRVMLAQVEQLSAGRESMLRAVADVRLLIDQVMGSLDGIEADAKAAADNALDQARRRAELDTPDLAELVPSELGAAALGEPPPSAGVLRIHTGPVPVASRPAGSEPVGAGAEDSVPGEPGANGAPAPGAPEPDLTADAAATPADAAAPSASPEAGAAGPSTTESRALPGPPAADEAAGSPGADEAAVHEPGYADRAPDEPERRISALRILRRSRPETDRHPSLGPPDVDEGIRILRPEPFSPTTGPETPEASEPGTAPSPGVQSSSESSESPEEIPAAGGSAPVGSPPAPGVSVGEPSPEGLADAARAEDHLSVDELFARLRADRAVAVDAAEETLAEAGLVKTEPDRPAPGLAGHQASSGEAEDPLLLAAADAAPEPDRRSGPVGDEEMLRQRDSLLADTQDRLSRKLKRTLQDDQNELLDRVRNSFRHPDQPVLMPEPEQLERFRLAALPLLAEAFETGCQFALVHVPGSAAVSDPPAGARAEGLAADLVGQLRARLGDVLAERGLDEAAMAEGVGSVYRAWKGDRVEGLATDHLIGAFQAGVLASVPAQARLRWVANDDGGPCPDCDDNVLAGPTPVGSEYPTGQAQPPAHPGCRCLLVPDLT